MVNRRVFTVMLGIVLVLGLVLAGCGDGAGGGDNEKALAVVGASLFHYYSNGSEESCGVTLRLSGRFTYDGEEPSSQFYPDFSGANGFTCDVGNVIKVTISSGHNPATGAESGTIQLYTDVPWQATKQGVPTKVSYDGSLPITRKDGTEKLAAFSNLAIR
jgi:hypothetical protein